MMMYASLLVACVFHTLSAAQLDGADLTLDQVILNRTQAPQDGSLIDGRYILVGRDILVTKSQYRDFYSDKRGHDVKGHGAPSNMLWPGGVVPYVLDQSLRGDTNMIMAAMRRWEQVTCVRFRQATASDRNRIRIAGGKGCNSYIGVVGQWQEQPLNLEYPGCWENRIILHELGHAIGLHHEMTHPNAGNYIDIQWQNMKTECRKEYQVQQGATQTYGFDYDMMSIMHYGPYDCSIQYGRLYTVKTKDPSKQNIVGSAKVLSQTDINIVKKMYQGKCSGTTTNTGNTCKDNVSPCYTNYCSDTNYATNSCPKTCGRCGTTTNPGTTCRDAVSPCYTNYCSNQAYATNSCPRTCGRCTTTGGTTCRDAVSPCYTNYCSNQAYATNSCPRTCGRCTTTGGSCVDSNQSCGYWANIGECTRNSAFMMVSCRKSCRQC